MNSGIVQPQQQNAPSSSHSSHRLATRHSTLLEKLTGNDQSGVGRESFLFTFVPTGGHALLIASSIPFVQIMPLLLHVLVVLNWLTHYR